MSNLEYTNNTNQIDAAFSIRGGVFDKVNKRRPGALPDFKQLLKQVVEQAIKLNTVAIGINYNSPYCFTFKRWVLQFKDQYPYGKLLKKLGLDKEGNNSDFGFASYHNSSNGISAQFKEKEIAFNINQQNGVDNEYNKSITVETTKNSKSYKKFISDEYQNSMECKAYKNACEKVAPIFQDMVLAPYNSKKIKRTENYNNRIIDGKNKGMRATTTLSGSAKTDLIDLNTGICISVKNGNSSQLASTSPVEWLTILDFIFNEKNIKVDENDKKHIYEIFDYKNMLYKRLYGQVTDIRKNEDHKSYSIICQFDAFHEYATDELNKFCIKYPEFKKALFIELAKGESKFTETCGAIAQYILNFQVNDPDKTEFLPIEEYINKHMDNMKIKVTYKSTTPNAYAFTTVRVYINN